MHQDAGWSCCCAVDVAVLAVIQDAFITVCTTGQVALSCCEALITLAHHVPCKQPQFVKA